MIAGDIEIDTSANLQLVARPGSKAACYGGTLGWARTVRAYLVGRGFAACIVVGFDPDRVRSCARGLPPGAHVLTSPDHEIATTASLPIDALALPDALAQAARDAGIRTIGALSRASHPTLVNARRAARALLDGVPQLAFDTLPKSA